MKAWVDLVSLEHLSHSDLSPPSSSHSFFGCRLSNIRIWWNGKDNSWDGKFSWWASSAIMRLEAWFTIKLRTITIINHWCWAEKHGCWLVLNIAQFEEDVSKLSGSGTKRNSFIKTVWVKGIVEKSQYEFSFSSELRRNEDELLYLFLGKGEERSGELRLTPLFTFLTHTLFTNPPPRIGSEYPHFFAEITIWIMI